MRAAYISADSGVPVFGSNGSSAHVRAVLRALEARGVRLELFASRFDGAPPADLAHLPLHVLPRAARRLPQAEREALAVAANAALAQELDAAGPFDFIYERHSLWSAAGMRTAAAMGVPGLLEVNAPLLEETARFRTLIDHAAAERQVRAALEAATALLAVSPGVADYLQGFAEAAGKVHVVANGVEPARFTPTVPRRPADAPFRIGFVGSLRPWHGVDQLIEALGLLVRRGLEARLLIVGKGPERQRLAELAEARGVAERIEWTGAVPEDAVPEQLARMDIAAAPYPASAGFYFSPLKLFEYMAAGLPIVTTAAGDLASIIDHGRTGWLCPNGTAEEIAHGIAALATDPAGSRRLGQAARAQAVEHHSWAAVAARILGIADAAGAGAAAAGRGCAA